MCKRQPFGALAIGLCLTALVGIGSTLNLALDVGRPFPGFLLLHAINANVWVIDLETPGYWPVFDHLPWGGLIETVEGRPPDNTIADVYRRAYQLANRTTAVPSATVTMQIESSGQRGQFILPVKPFTWGEWLDLKLPRLISGLVFWLLALAIVRNALPGNPTARACARSAMVTAAVLWAGSRSLFHMDLSAESRVLDRIVDLAGTWLYGFAAARYVALGAYYPTPMRHARMIDLTSQVVCALSATVFALGHVLVYANRQWVPLAGWFDRVGYQCTIALLIASSFFWFARLVVEAIRHWRRLHRRLAALVPLTAMAIAFAVSAISLIPGLAQFLPRFVYEPLAIPSLFLHELKFDLRYSALFAPLAFTYIILRNQATASQSRIFLLAIIIAVSALFASTADAIIRAAADRATFSVSPFVVAFTACMTTGLLWCWAATSQRLLWRVFQWQTVSNTAFVWFSRRLPTENVFKDPRQAPRAITQTLAQEFRLERCALWLRPADSPLAASPELIASEGAPFHIDAPDLTLLGNETRFIEEGRAVILPMRMMDDVVGYIGVGKRNDEDVFHESDIPLLMLAAQYAALLLIALKNVEQVRAVPMHIAQAQERERARIGNDLHDTTQQFLGRLPIYLGSLEDAAEGDRARFDALLRRIEDEIAQEAVNLRQIRRSISPIELDATLLRPLEALLHRAQNISGLNVSLSYSQQLDERLSPALRQALYRVIQQAVDNVVEHACASQIVVRVESNEAAKHITFEVWDDGCGFDLKQPDWLRAHGHYGLVSMTERVETAGGQLSIQSTPRQGTRIFGWLPM